MSLRRLVAAGVALLLMTFSAWAEDTQVRQMEIDTDHVTSWNRFADRVYDLHLRQIDGREIRQSTETGEYGGSAARGYGYKETSYYDARTGLLLSRVRTDRDRPKVLHIVEVYLHDRQGRVVRDYSFLYLPWAHNAPILTAINVHQYNRDLHAYRQFDASGERMYERCIGMHAAEKVDISLEEQDIGPPITESDAYQACFAGMQTAAGIYLTPQ